MQLLYVLICMRCIFHLLIKWGTPLALQWRAVKWNDISCWWMSPRGLFWPCSCDMFQIRIASCQNSLLLAQERNYKYRLHCRKPITNILTVKMDGIKKTIIYWECNPWSCKSNSLPSAGNNTDGSTQTKDKEHHKITREKCPAFAGIMVGVISLPLPLGQRTIAFAFYQSLSIISSSGSPLLPWKLGLLCRLRLPLALFSVETSIQSGLEEATPGPVPQEEDLSAIFLLHKIRPGIWLWPCSKLNGSCLQTLGNLWALRRATPQVCI